MQKTAKQFLDLLESQQLLAPDILGELRRQVSESKSRLTSELLARLLVDNGHLTKFQATKLIAELSASSAKGPTSSSSTPSDELGFAEDPLASKQSPNSGATPAPVAKVFVDDDSEIKSAQPPSDAVPVEISPAGVTPTDGQPLVPATKKNLGDTKAKRSSRKTTPPSAPPPHIAPSPPPRSAPHPQANP